MLENKGRVEEKMFNVPKKKMFNVPKKKKKKEYRLLAYGEWLTI